MLTNKATFENLKYWKEEIEKIIRDYCSILVGNKADLVNAECSDITKEEYNELLQYLGASSYFETSAKLGTGVENFFIDLVSNMYKTYHR
ncbi:MAG: hypothetical protein ACFFDF_02160 [Candidatus Odinarchaeota archaeon]